MTPDPASTVGTARRAVRRLREFRRLAPATRRIVPAGALVCAASLAAARLPAAEPAPLTTAASVLALPAEQAAGRLPVRLTGVVTVAERDWNGRFFVQDRSAGVFVENLDGPAPAVGDLVEIAGFSHPGAFAPIVTSPRWRRIGSAALPPPGTVPIEDLEHGSEDGQRVEIEGIVRTAALEQERLWIDLSVAGHRLQVSTRIPPGVAPGSLVGSRVRVRGTAATHFIGALRHLTSVAVYAPRLEDFAVLAPESSDPFGQPAIPVNGIAQYRPGWHAEQRLRVRGAVTFHDGGAYFIQDESGGIRVEAARAEDLAVGDPVDAAGFLEYEGRLPVLRDAVLRRAAGSARAIAAARAPFSEIAAGEHHGELVALKGVVLDRSVRPGGGEPGRPQGALVTWVVQGSEATFTAECRMPHPRWNAPDAPLGSLVQAEGVCVLTIDADGRTTSLRLLLPSPASLTVLKRPSWFTPARLLAVLGAVTAVLVVVAGWLLTVSRKNAALNRLVGELEQARSRLQEAHDTLEQKVAERTAELHVEMTARKEAEVRFKAVLAERTRLARDLHDTLEQNLAGIALRLNTANRLSRRDPEAADSHLQFARSWLHQSQVDLRRSIWDLRSRELEQFDLARALRASAEQLVEGTPLALEFRAEGRAPGLSEVVEENVLRIGQEALTNVAKHAGASRIRVVLEFAPGLVRLGIEDDGVGFDRGRVPPEGHYGLTGMEERAKRIGGSLRIESTPGRGTSVLLEIALP